MHNQSWEMMLQTYQTYGTQPTQQWQNVITWGDPAPVYTPFQQALADRGTPAVYGDDPCLVLLCDE